MVCLLALFCEQLKTVVDQASVQERYCIESA